jgi:hypothetical protein
VVRAASWERREVAESAGITSGAVGIRRMHDQLERPTVSQSDGCGRMNSERER